MSFFLEESSLNKTLLGKQCLPSMFDCVPSWHQPASLAPSPEHWLSQFNSACPVPAIFLSSYTSLLWCNCLSCFSSDYINGKRSYKMSFTDLFDAELHVLYYVGSFTELPIIYCLNRPRSADPNYMFSICYGLEYLVC